MLLYCIVSAIRVTTERLNTAVAGQCLYECVRMYSVVDADVTPPQFTTRLEPVTVVRGENAKLRAAVTGD